MCTDKPPNTATTLDHTEALLAVSNSNPGTNGTNNTGALLGAIMCQKLASCIAKEPVSN